MKSKKVRRRITLGDSQASITDASSKSIVPTEAGRVEGINLISILSQHDREVEPRREGLSSIHVTAALSADFCERREWIIRHYETAAGNNTPFSSQRIIWALGRAAERHVRDTLLLSLKGNAVGVWSCACGREYHRGQYDAEKQCGTCSTPLDNYGEHQAMSPSGNVSGSIDFLYRDEMNYYAVLEIKSIQKADYEKLTSPLTSHRDQCSFYVYLLRLRGIRVRKASVLYVAKDAVAGSPYKTFDIPLETPASVVKAHQDAERAFQEEIPEKRSGCSTPSSPVARKCSQCAMCFSLA